MSIDVQVIPTGPPARWVDVRNRLLGSNLPSGARDLLGESPDLLTHGCHRAIALDEQLAPGSHYYLRLREDNTLGLSLDDGVTTDPDEPLSYLEDFGHNIDPVTIQEWALRWERAGYCYRVSSWAGRHPCELPVFVALATVLAELSGAVVMVEDEGWFGVGVGVYSPDVFRRGVWDVGCRASSAGGSA
jgi:hypothetical protein